METPARIRKNASNTTWTRTHARTTRGTAAAVPQIAHKNGSRLRGGGGGQAEAMGQSMQHCTCAARQNWERDFIDLVGPFCVIQMPSARYVVSLSRPASIFVTAEKESVRKAHQEESLPGYLKEGTRLSE